MLSEAIMKGGKGGIGRQRSTNRVNDRGKPHPVIKKGAPKKDWGAIDKDIDVTPVRDVSKNASKRPGRGKP